MAHANGVSQGDQRTIDQALEDRISGLTTWLREHAPECFDEQRHLDEGMAERVYWHYGYLVALRDVRDFLARRRVMPDTLAVRQVCARCGKEQTMPFHTCLARG